MKLLAGILLLGLLATLVSTYPVRAYDERPDGSVVLTAAEVSAMLAAHSAQVAEIRQLRRVIQRDCK